MIPSPSPSPPSPPYPLLQLHRLVVYNIMQLSPDLSTCPRPPCPPYSVLLTTADDTCVAATSADHANLLFIIQITKSSTHRRLSSRTAVLCFNKLVKAITVCDLLNEAFNGDQGYSHACPFA